MYLVVSPESSFTGVGSSWDRLTGRGIQAVLGNVVQSEPATVQRQTQDKFGGRGAFADPVVDGVFLLTERKLCFIHTAH